MVRCLENSKNQDCPKRATQERDGTVPRLLNQPIFIVYG